MKDCRQLYIDGKWVAPTTPNDFPVTNPATEETIATISLGSAADVDKAVKAARKAFETFGETTPAERLDILNRIIAAYQAHYDELVESVSTEMGAPLWLSRAAQVAAGMGHFFEMTKVLSSFQFEEAKGSTLMRKEPIGVCGLITPWNWPLNQIACKVAPALAAGCTMVLKPSEIAPLSGYLFAKIIDEAGVPAGVFNLVNGDGPTVGAAIASHPGVDMVSFTGSTRAGVAVAQAAAPTVKRVTQELGGKSANIILDDADVAAAVTAGVLGSYKFEELKGSTLMRKEPIGVCGLITPWNWPVNQIACKVAPALAAGCTMVLKPSEVAPLSGYLFTQILHEAGVPAGVYNMVNGDGPTVGPSPFTMLKTPAGTPASWRICVKR